MAQHLFLDSSINFLWTEDGKQLGVSYFKNNCRVLTWQVFLSLIVLLFNDFQHRKGHFEVVGTLSSVDHNLFKEAFAI